MSQTSRPQKQMGGAPPLKFERQIGRCTEYPTHKNIIISKSLVVSPEYVMSTTCFFSSFKTYQGPPFFHHHICFFSPICRSRRFFVGDAHGTWNIFSSGNESMWWVAKRLTLGNSISDEPKTFIFRGYNPIYGGFKPSFFMVLGSKGVIYFGSTPPEDSSCK